MVARSSLSVRTALWCGFSLLPACAAAGPDVRHRHAVTLARAQPVAAFDTDPFAGAVELERGVLVSAVLARNPDVAAARAGWRRALARYPQARAIDDPVVRYRVAPLSIAGDAPFGHAVEIEQMVPWPGKRGLAGEVALAEADARRGEVEEVRLRLALMTALLFDDYYVVARALEVNARHQALLGQIAASVEVQYAVGRGSPQDPLQAQTSIVRADRERIGFETERAVVVAQLNGLLHRDPEAPIPPPPHELALPLEATLDGLDAAALASTALGVRPELSIRGAEAAQAEASRRLAAQGARPDLGIMAGYDSMWDMAAHRWMVGVSVAIPLVGSGRTAAVDEAEAGIAQARHDRSATEDMIRVEVATAVARLHEARAVGELFDRRLLPAARAQVDAALAGYISDQNSLQVVIESQRGLRDAELDRERARADVHRRLAELDRAVGKVPGLDDGGVR